MKTSFSVFLRLLLLASAMGGVTRQPSNAAHRVAYRQTLENDIAALRKKRADLGVRNQELEEAKALDTRSEAAFARSEAAFTAANAVLQKAVDKQEGLLTLAQQALTICKAEKASLKDQLSQEQEKTRTLTLENARLQRLLADKTPRPPAFPRDSVPTTATLSYTESATTQRREDFTPSSTLRAIR